MAILSMKRLHLLGLLSEQDSLFNALQKIGCLEVRQADVSDLDPEDALLLHPNESALESLKPQQETAARALKTLDAFAPEKTSFLSPLATIQTDALFDNSTRDSAAASAEKICSYQKQLDETADTLRQISTAKQAMLPWKDLDLPLDTSSTASTIVLFGTVPSSVSIESVQKDLAINADAAELIEASSDQSAHYLLFFCHRSVEEEAMDVLRSVGFSTMSFRDIHGTAAERISVLDHDTEVLNQKTESLQESIRAASSHRDEIRILYDRLSQDIKKEETKERLLDSESIYYLDGWVPDEDTEKLVPLLESYTCAYELSDPAEEEYGEVPIKLKNSPITRCMNVITEMYSLPAYDGIDPNPLMAPFFIVFFGMMMADMAYGILMIAAALIVLKKKRPRTGTRNFMELVLYCGISTFIWGALTGGFFGDFIPKIARIINPNSTLELPHLFTPLDDTIAILLGSLVLGVIQIFTGMGVSVWKKCRDGNWQDALWDEVTWWIILIGVACMVLKIGTPGGIPVVLIIGAVMLVYGSTRNAKGFGKVASFVAAVYNGVTGFFSDILSYLRLMALMLSGSVIAQVFNTLGSVFGSVIPFIIIALIGNMLNLALNLLGCYVHDLRLQCLEYFGRFYKEGGKPYTPLSIDTKYHDII